MISWFKKPEPPYEPEPSRPNFVPRFQVEYSTDKGFYVYFGCGDYLLASGKVGLKEKDECLDYFETEFDAIEAVYRMACKHHQEYMINKRLKQQW